jgi:hypothetical protein
MADINLQIDPKSMERITQRFDHIGKNLGGAARTPLGDLLNSAALRLETLAKRKLTIGRHVVTGRLRSSIHAKLTNTDSYNYSDKDGNTFDGSIKETVSPGKSVVIGTNVEYAQKIELLDSYLYYASNFLRPELERKLQRLCGDVVKGREVPEGKAGQWGGNTMQANESF